MKTKLKILIFFILFNNLSATDRIWKFNNKSSKINFSVSYLVRYTVEGEFKEFDGTITNHKDDFEDGRIILKIKTKSIKTGNKIRDNHLRDEDFLNVDKFKTIEFQSYTFKKISNDFFTITGELNINGIKNIITFDANLLKKDGKNIFKSTTSVDRTKYNVYWQQKIDPNGILIGYIVRINLFIVIE